MKTDDLIAMLAQGEVTVPADTRKRRYAMAVATSALVSALLMVITLGVRPDIAAAAQLPMFWAKLAFTLVFSMSAFLVVERLARPGVKLGWTPMAVFGALAMVWVVAAIALFNAPVEDRAGLIFGQTWIDCTATIATLSVPAFIAVFWALRGLAPTRLRLSGAAAGLLAGGVGALVYSFHCDEMAAPFLATWYVLGIAIPAMAGAALGPRLLRW